jgi:galactonate dehydratase
MKIAKIRSIFLKSSNHHFVRVYAGNGMHGTGETFDTIGAAEIVNRYFDPALAGRDPLEVVKIYHDLWTTQPIPGGQGPMFMRGMGGPYLCALSALEMALWDLTGKALGVPVYQLLGGKHRSRIPVYFHAHTPETAREIVRKTNCKVVKAMIDGVLDRMRADGQIANPYGIVHAGTEKLSYGEIDAIASHVLAMREAVGPDVGLAVDAHGRYDQESAIQLARALELARLLWLEEPVPSDNLDALAAIRRRTTTPIACGENVFTRYGYRQLLEKQAVAVIQPDAGKCGGLWETRQVAALAETHYVPVAAHNMYSPLGTMACAHLCAAIPNLMLLEWGSYFDDTVNAIAEMPTYHDGFLELSDAPGLGVALHDDILNGL